MLMDMCLPKFDTDQTNTNKHKLFKKKFCLMSGVKFTLSDITSFLRDNLSGLQKNCSQVRALGADIIYTYFDFE